MPRRPALDPPPPESPGRTDRSDLVSMQGRPTLLVFSRGIAAESSRRQLLPGSLRHVEDGTHRAFLDAALLAGEVAGCALAVCSPRPLDLGPAVAHIPQCGADFGTRVEAATSRAFARRPSVLLIAASDVPGLRAEHLARAIELLRADPERVVLGPSPDGGLYLIAATRPIPDLGTATRWCRRDTLVRLERTLAGLGRPVVRLEPLRDLDARADLESWLADGAAIELPLRPLARFLRAALASLHPEAPAVLGFVRSSFHPAHSGRAPPSHPASR